METERSSDFDDNAFKLGVTAIIKTMGELIHNNYHSATNGGRQPKILYPDDFLDVNRSRLNTVISSLLARDEEETLVMSNALCTVSSLLSGSQRIFDKDTSEVFTNALRLILQEGVIMTTGYEVLQGPSTVRYYGTSHWAYPSAEPELEKIRRQPHREIVILHYDQGIASGSLEVLDELLSA